MSEKENLRPKAKQEISEEEKLKSIRLRAEMSTCRFIHVLKNDKFCKPIVDFINRHFDPEEHFFIFLQIYAHSFDEFPLPEGDNVFYSEDPACLAVSSLVSKVIFHGMYSNIIADHVRKHPEILEKAYWIPWGGDLYNPLIQPNKSLPYVQARVRGVAGNARIIAEYKRRYGSEGKVFLPFNVTFESIPYAEILAQPIPQKDYVQILVNNSAHPSTLEVLRALEKFKDENIRVATVLSYGATQHNQEILELGQSIFADKFFALTEYVPPDEYLKFLAKNDIYIMNQERPQGMTTAFTAMLLGQKIFMREECSGYLSDEGYTIYPTASLPDLSFAELCALDPADAEKNRQLADRRFNPKQVAEAWRNIFEYEP